MVANCAAVAASCRTDRVGSPSMLPRLEPRQPLHPVSKAGFSGQPKLEIIRFYVQSYYKVEYKVRNRLQIPVFSASNSIVYPSRQLLGRLYMHNDR
ncbi:hypothetical protein TWF751_007629 [Orbilia oligospora]|nr:hypothetical protein TWF751_007629 [Orbilia oligospora]KAF3243080.1 hypothetical protein TWF128_010304 [Orbilia oligospora]